MRTVAHKDIKNWLSSVNAHRLCWEHLSQSTSNKSLVQLTQVFTLSQMMLLFLCCHSLSHSLFSNDVNHFNKIHVKWDNNIPCLHSWNANVVKCRCSSMMIFTLCIKLTSLGWWKFPWQLICKMTQQNSCYLAILVTFKVF